MFEPSLDSLFEGVPMPVTTSGEVGQAPPHRYRRICNWGRMPACGTPPPARGAERTQPSPGPEGAHATLEKDIKIYRPPPTAMLVWWSTRLRATPPAALLDKWSPPTMQDRHQLRCECGGQPYDAGPPPTAMRVWWSVLRLELSYVRDHSNWLLT